MRGFVLLAGVATGMVLAAVIAIIYPNTPSNSMVVIGGIAACTLLVVLWVLNLSTLRDACRVVEPAYPLLDHWPAAWGGRAQQLHPSEYMQLRVFCDTRAASRAVAERLIARAGSWQPREVDDETPEEVSRLDRATWLNRTMTAWSLRSHMGTISLGNGVDVPKVELWCDWGFRPGVCVAFF